MYNLLDGGGLPLSPRGVYLGGFLVAREMDVLTVTLLQNRSSYNDFKELSHLRFYRHELLSELFA